MGTQFVCQKRFGVVAVEKQYVTKEQVCQALQVQVDENVQKGVHRQIGAILFDMGQMNAGQIQSVIGELNSITKVAV